MAEFFNSPERGNLQMFWPAATSEQNRDDAAAADVNEHDLLGNLPTALQTRAWKRGRMFCGWSERVIELKGNMLLVYKLDRRGKPIRPAAQAVCLRGYTAQVRPDVKCKHGDVISLTHPSQRTYFFCLPSIISASSSAAAAAASSAFAAAAVAAASSAVDGHFQQLSPQQWAGAMNARGRAATGLSDFQIIKPLGKGGYGEVSLALHKPSGHLMALKSVPKRAPAPADQQDNAVAALFDFEEHERQVRHVRRVIDERASHAFLRNRHLVQLHHAFQTSTHWYYAMEFCRGGEVFALSRLQANCRVPESIVRLWAAQLVLALEHIHASGFVHRDLKPENVLLDHRGNVKLADFGFAKRLPLMPNGKLGRSYTFCGTKSYMSPEMLTGDRAHGVGVDFWSLGVLVYELLTGFPPFRGRTRIDVYNSILNTPVSFPNVNPALTLSDAAKSLISELLHKNPYRRIGVRDGMAELKAHPFFAQVNWQLLEAGIVRVPVEELKAFQPASADPAAYLSSSRSSSPVPADVLPNARPSTADRTAALHLHGFSFDAELEFAAPGHAHAAHHHDDADAAAAAAAEDKKAFASTDSIPDAVMVEADGMNLHATTVSATDSVHSSASNSPSPSLLEAPRVQSAPEVLVSAKQPAAAAAAAAPGASLLPGVTAPHEQLANSLMLPGLKRHRSDPLPASSSFMDLLPSRSASPTHSLDDLEILPARHRTDILYAITAQPQAFFALDLAVAA